MAAPAKAKFFNDLETPNSALDILSDAGAHLLFPASKGLTRHAPGEELTVLISQERDKPIWL
jgi:hypothetical protein